MTRGVFITGTDFGVGKSRIGATLAAVLNARGEPVRLCRPATSHTSSNRGDLFASPSTSRSRPQLTPYPSGSPAGAAWPTHGLEELHRACVAGREEREFYSSRDAAASIRRLPATHSMRISQEAWGCPSLSLRRIIGAPSTTP